MEGEHQLLGLPENEGYTLKVNNILDLNGYQPKDGEEFIDSTRKYAEPEYVLEKDGIGLMPLSNLTIISAKAKQGKTWLQVILAAAMLGDNSFGFKCLIEDMKILYIDTDQQSSQTARLKRRIQRLAGIPVNENQAELMVVNIRKMSTEERKAELNRLIEEFQPTVVFVDNILHIESDFNDPVHSRQFVDMLLKLVDAYHCLLIGVIHENKSQNDTNSKGHVGTMTDESACDKLKASRDTETGVFTISHVLSRDRTIEDFGFVISDEGLPVLETTAKEQKRQKKAAEERSQREQLFKSIFNEHLYGLSKSDLVAELTRNAGYKKSNAYKVIDKAVEEGTLQTTDDGLLIALF